MRKTVAIITGALTVAGAITLTGLIGLAPAATSSAATATPPTRTTPTPTAAKATPSAATKTQEPQLGIGADMGGRRPFPADNPWNQDISASPVDANSDRLIAKIGAATSLHPDFGKDFGIPYVVVAAAQPKVPVKFEYADESDPGPYPIPPTALIEGGPDSRGDRHVLVIDRDNWKLFELYASVPEDGGKRWRAGSGAIFDLNSNKQRPLGWTSADAAGLPIFPGLVRYDEVVTRKTLDHAVRFTVAKTRRALVAPATHFAPTSSDPEQPPMGMRVRLKATYDTTGFPPSARTILEGLKKYGMILADNGSNWYVTGAPDSRWNDDDLNTLKRVKGKDFEVLKLGDVVTQR
jgi:hypothetical protein